MKKIAILMILCLFAVDMVNAQRRELSRAKRQLNRGNLELAFNHISNASNDPTTKENPDTWVTKTRILIEIANSQEPAILNLVENPLDKAYEAITKAQTLDVTNIHIINIQQSLLVLSEGFYNAGAIAYQASKYEAASNNFLRSFQVAGEFGTTDTTTLYNAALSAEIAGLNDKAVELYIQVADLNYDQPFLYTSLTNIFMRNKEFEEAEKWVKAGRQRYPDNLELIFAEANLYLTTGQVTEARQILELAIERDPDNANLHFVFGINFEQMARDTTITDSDRQFAREQAIKAYRKAIEIQPDYFDAYFSLGALFFNEGLSYFNQADNILRGGYTTENLRKSGELEDKSKRIWKEDAQPYLEKALSMLSLEDDNYEIVLRSLRELYFRTGQLEKVEETNEIWNTRFARPEEE